MYHRDLMMWLAVVMSDGGGVLRVVSQVISPLGPLLVKYVEQDTESVFLLKRVGRWVQ